MMSYCRVIRVDSICSVVIVDSEMKSRASLTTIIVPVTDIARSQVDHVRAVASKMRGCNLTSVLAGM